jgi:hypothetical protein
MTEKVFSPGEVLTAADVNDYLVNRTGSGNAIINGAFDIWQRGTSFTAPATTGFFAADRFFVSPGVNGVITATRETFTPGSAPLAGIESEFYIKLNQTTQGDATTFNLQQYIENVRTFAGQTVTLSFYARVSTGTHAITPELVQRFGSGGSSAVVTAGQVVTANTNWQRFTMTFVVPSVAGKTIGAGSSLQLRFGVGIATVKAYEYWGVQLEAGSVATPFKRNANSLQGELAACQRYFFRGGPGAQGIATLTTLANLIISYPVPMRAAPSVSHVANYNVLEVNVATRTATALESFSGGTLACNLGVTVGAGGMTVSNMVRISGATGPNLDFSAEL